MIMNYFLSSPKIGLLLISGLGINLSWLVLLPWSWNSLVTLMMTAYILKLSFNRHTIKQHISYDLGLMGGSCIVFLGLNYVLTETLELAPVSAAIIAHLWTWVALTMLFNKMVPAGIRQEFALGHKPA
jgi:hypothetical protein